VNVEPDLRYRLGELETHIYNGSDIEETLNALNAILRQSLGIENTHATFAQMLSLLAKKPSQYKHVAIIISRCMTVEKLIPDFNHSTERLVVKLCEEALPNFFSYLGISEKLQTFEKYNKYQSLHSRVEEILLPLCIYYVDIDALLNAQRKILGGLNNDLVAEYCGVYGIDEIRITIESIFSKIRQVKKVESTLSTDAENCIYELENVRIVAQKFPSFLTLKFFSAFVDTCKRSVDEFLESLRSQFSANIVWAGRPNGEVQKRFPLHEPGREIQISIPFRNSGPGVATDVRLSIMNSSEKVSFEEKEVSIGNVQPSDFSVTLTASVISMCSSLTCPLELCWKEIGSPHIKTQSFDITVLPQSACINWQKLENKSPYSTQVAMGDQFIGRKEKIGQIASKLLQHPMESFYITGQKRTGKTSLAHAVVEFAKDNNSNLVSDYIMWGDFADVDSNNSLHNLGCMIEGLITEHFPEEEKIQPGDYHGSLSNLISLLRRAKKIIPDKMFVMIVDEFDEIHQELFLQGNLAETFFGNLRALSRCQNMCMILVGGENMPFIMDRQGQKLNNFPRVNLSYFSRENEWEDFRLLIQEPTKGILNWHDDAVSEVFNISNGNPYFAKIICAEIFKRALQERDADITIEEVNRVIEKEVPDLGENSFVHLWQDGIHKAINEREPVILSRMRTLVALSRCIREEGAVNLNSVSKHVSASIITETKIREVLNDFVRREVLSEENKRYTFQLPIFRFWLKTSGLKSLVADSMNEELSEIVLAQDKKAEISAKEIVDLVEEWPPYRGKKFSADDVRAWFEQVDGARP